MRKCLQKYPDIYPQEEKAEEEEEKPEQVRAATEPLENKEKVESS